MLRKIVGSSKDNAVFLDIGCGLGDWTSIIAEKRRVIGIEINTENARSTIHNVRTKCFLGVVVYDGNNLPFSDGSIDSICMIEVIEHVTDDDKLVSECYRVLKNGGSMVLTTPNNEIEILNPIIHHGHIRHYSKNEILGLLEDKGFKILDFLWRMHYVTGLIDDFLVTKAREHAFTSKDFGHNVYQYQFENERTPFKLRALLWIYEKIVKPLIYLIVISEFNIKSKNSPGRNMIIIVEK